MTLKFFELLFQSLIFLLLVIAILLSILIFFVIIVRAISIALLGRLLADKCQKFLQRDNLVIKFDLPLIHGLFTFDRIRGFLSQLSDFPSDLFDFISVMLVLIVDSILKLLLLLLLILLWVFSTELSLGFDIVQDLVLS